MMAALNYTCHFVKEDLTSRVPDLTAAHMAVMEEWQRYHRAGLVQARWEQQALAGGAGCVKVADPESRWCGRVDGVPYLQPMDRNTAVVGTSVVSALKAAGIWTPVWNYGWHTWTAGQLQGTVWGAVFVDRPRFRVCPTGKGKPLPPGRLGCRAKGGIPPSELLDEYARVSSGARHDPLMEAGYASTA